MLRDIIKKEIMDHITSPKFVFTFLLCAILILISTFTGINNYRSDMGEYNAANSLNKQNLDNQPNYQALAGIGTQLTKKPEVLSAITTGIQQAVGRQANVNIAYDPTLEDSKYNSNPVFAIFGELDLTFIVKIVLSLFAILFTYDAIVGEKENGTLKLALTNRVPRDRLILGKAIGGFISLLMPLIIPMLLSIILLVIYPDISLVAEDWGRIGLTFLLYLLYLSVFFTLGLFVSARTNRSSTSLLVLLFVWVIFVTVIPKASVMVAGQLNPIPSMHEVTAQKRAFLQEIQGQAQPRMGQWMQDNPRETTLDFQEKFRDFLGNLQNELTAEIDAKNQQIEEEYQAKRRQQRLLALNISRISPASALAFGAMSFSKTGIEEHERYANSIKTYKPVWTQWANTRMMQTLNLDDPGAAPVKPDISDMPIHEFKSETIRDSFERAIPDFVVLTLLIILFFAGAFVSFLKYDVR